MSRAEDKKNGSNFERTEQHLFSNHNDAGSP